MGGGKGSDSEDHRRGRSKSPKKHGHKDKGKKHHSKSPKKHHSKSPKRHHSKSPKRYHSKSPKRSKSPVHSCVNHPKCVNEIKELQWEISKLKSKMLDLELKHCKCHGHTEVTKGNIGWVSGTEVGTGTYEHSVHKSSSSASHKQLATSASTYTYSYPSHRCND